MPKTSKRPTCLSREIKLVIGLSSSLLVHKVEQPSPICCPVASVLEYQEILLPLPWEYEAARQRHSYVLAVRLAEGNHSLEMNLKCSYEKLILTPFAAEGNCGIAS